MVKQIICGGLIVDGSGGEPYHGDILIIDDIIEAIGHVSCSVYESAKTIPAAGKCVTPGFIDTHRHADYAVFEKDFGHIELAQGITTVITGACGLTPYPYAPEMEAALSPILGEKPFVLPDFFTYREKVKKLALPVNIGGMLGSCNLRAFIKGMVSAPLTKPEIKKTKDIIEKAMTDGALGLSMGLMYPPEVYASMEELVEIATAAAKHNRILTVHLRGEGDSLVSSIKEAAKIAERADIPLTISHFKVCGENNWGKGLYEAIELIERLRKSQDIAVEFYPYHGGATTLRSLLPPDFPKNEWADENALRQTLTTHHKGWDNYIKSLGFERIILNNLREHADFNGRNIAEIALMTGKDPYALLSDILKSEGASAGVIVMSMSPQDVDTVARLPYANVISDALYGGKQSAHPRLYAAFSKLIRDFIVDRSVLSLPEAVHKMTAQPAKRMGIHKRGLLHPGYAADINIFSPEKIKDHSNFAQSGLLSTGMDMVFVNGKKAWKNQCRQEKSGRWIL